MADGGGGSSLPAELLQDVSGRLSTDTDVLHIHQVCTHWRTSTSALAAPRPWIIAGREPWQEAGPIGDYSFWLPGGGNGGRRQELRSGAPSGLPYCCGAPRGWLALTDSERSPTRLVLWDPVSRAEVSLPCLPAAAQVFLSGDPLATAGCWTAFAGQKGPPSRGVAQRLFSWRPGDAAWSPLQGGAACQRIDCAAFHQGRAYLIGASWRLRVYDLGLGAGAAGASPPRLVRSTSLRASAVKVFNSNGRSWFQTLRTLHAVPCGGELLLVLAYGGHRPAPAEVYRVGWEAEPLVVIGERVRDLGEHSLFVGRGDAFALSAREFPAVRRNCVYYVEHDNFWPEQW
ncbi:unnamed protein product [Urochloa humidicola]